MGSVKRDLHEGERRLEAQYIALDNPLGISLLLADYHAIESRKYAGDYDAVIIMTDLETAIERAGLSDMERAALRLVYIEDMTQVDAGASMGVAQYRVSRLLGAVHTKVARIYEAWARRGEGYTVTIGE